MALPLQSAFFRTPGSLDDDLAPVRQRPRTLSRIRVLGRGAARPRSVEGLPLGSGGNPGSVDGLCRLLRKRAHKC